MRAPALLLAAILVATVPATAGADTAYRVRPRAGVAYHPQLVAVGPAAGATFELGLFANGRVGVGLAVDHLRFGYRRTGVPLTSTSAADLEATVTLTPLLLELDGRLPLGESFLAFGGVGAGPTFTSVETRSVGGTGRTGTTDHRSILLAGGVHAGLGLRLGPGWFTLEGRLHAGSDEVDGAANDLWAGGVAGFAGYELGL